MEWTLQQIEKDSECCGNCIGCRKEFAQCSDKQYGCTDFVVEEDVLEK